ncbi:DUF4240 domain-containing protein [Myxococcus sp. CA040A]|uniref:DUF4240 domain-containing protein n=1 Tax=Myxococcus sp. CA040A TaxID=2741738 RepID=UPI00157ABCB3|nr:DUF4240 domain-containing protein [Myxococcus sp. CA040A]NTX00189.1 DUF4240 domain-containing protein [Myxococcus sp. CA040A]
MKASAQRAARFWKELLEEVVRPSVIVGFEDYYRRLSSWVIGHTQDFGAELLEESGLAVLARLDPSRYLSKSPEIRLDLELARLSSVAPKSMESVAMALSETLLDMVTVWSARDCPNCGGPMRIMVALSDDARRLFLRCRDCSHEEWEDFSRVETRVRRVLPATRGDVTGLHRAHAASEDRMAMEARVRGEAISDSFWDIIRRAEMRSDRLKRILWEMPEDEVARFHEEFVRASSVLRGSPFDAILDEAVSEDTLMDIAYWVVAQGREFYEGVLEHPNRIPRHVKGGDPAVMHHVAVEVFDERFGKELDFF